MVSNKTLSLVPDEMDRRKAHRLMLSVVAPRPIAWVSTIGPDGTPNLAPFSFFNGVSGNPPTVMFSVGRRQGEPKDTLRNVQETPEFVVNMVSEALAEAMNETAGAWTYGVSEFDVAGLEAAPSVDVKPPRVADTPVALEARVTQIVPVEGSTSTMVLGRIIRYHVREDLLRPNGQVDMKRLLPITRLGGNEYATIGDVFEMFRP